MKRLIPVLVVLVAVAVVVMYVIRTGQGVPVGSGGSGILNVRSLDRISLNGTIGGEKLGLFDDEAVKGMLDKQYRIASVSVTKAGSLDMVRGEPGPDQDFLWPSTQIASEIYKERHTGKSGTEIVLNSPIVLYSWDIVTDALVKQGIVKQTQGTYYVVDFSRLIKLIVAKKQWSDIGLQDLNGPITIRCTDPAKSSSGMTFFGLVANTLNGGNVVDENTLPAVMPTLQKLRRQLGFTPDSSADLFQQYLTQGVGACPMIVGYESQIIEYIRDNPDTNISSLRILYPKPTAWSSHPLIPLTDKGKRLRDALKTKEIQQLAWVNHGFRSGLPGVVNDPKLLKIPGIPERILNVSPLPSPNVMERVIQTLGNTQ